MEDKLREKDKATVESILTLEKDRFERWKYFEDRATKLTERLWTTGTWLVAILSAALALPFTAKFIPVLEGAKPLGAWPRIQLLSVAVFGLAFGVYAWFVLKDFKEHIERNWQRANFVLTHEYEEPPKFRKRGWFVLVIVLGLQLVAFGAFVYLAI